MKTFWAKYTETIRHEMGVWISIALSFLITDGYVTLVSIYQGDYSYEVLRALKMLLLSSCIKALLVLLFQKCSRSIKRMWEYYRRKKMMRKHNLCRGAE